jgi:serine protease Do
VKSVAPDGPAAKAGIHVGDILLRANGRPLRTFLDWEAAQLDLNVGDPIVVTVRAGGVTADHRIITGDLPTVTANRVRVLKGLDLITVTPAVRVERNVVSQAGALVVRVEPDIAAQIGVEVGDVIIGIDQQPLRTAEEVSRALAAVRPGQIFILRLERGGQRGDIQLRMNQ